MEIWKDIPGYEGYYKASDKGNIKSLVFQSNLYNKKIKREKVLKQKIGKDNTCRIELWKDGEHKTWSVHRLIGMTFLENKNYKELTINHKDGNRQNNNVDNLEWVSLADNIRHGFKNKLYSNQKETTIIDKNNNKKYVFNSMSSASAFIGFKEKYISGKIKKGIFENDSYRWWIN